MSQRGRGRSYHSEPSYGSDAPLFNCGKETKVVVGYKTQVLHRRFSPNWALAMVILESLPLRLQLKLPRRHRWLKHQFLADWFPFNHLPAGRRPLSSVS
ncbi:hypothetical protein ACFX1X_012992 [Malus domestica]